jgi:phosphatidylinositol alpha-1,6-mannosyltransferase
MAASESRGYRRSSMARVLFVSKPIVPPWHDGSKNLVRDIASHLSRHHATVMTTLGVDAPAGANGWPVYETPGRFAPGLSANLRVLGALVRARGFDAWNFVFAPNVASSTAARPAIMAGRARGVRLVVQTIASRPRSFRGVSSLLFGDVVVALSEWTRARLLAVGVDGKRLVVIPPCARAPRTPTSEERAAIRTKLGVGDAPLVVYPGDLEVSTGAITTASAVGPLLAKIPEARVVFACRKKTESAEAREGALQVSLARQGLGHAVCFAGELPDLAPLLAEASAIAFPVDDLYGKVDIPLVVLEALALGVPLVLARGGPLESVTSARFVEAAEPDDLSGALVELVGDAAARRAQAERGAALYRERFHPSKVAAQYESLYDVS